MPKQIVGYNRHPQNWNARQIAKMMENGTARFNNAVQRGYVWSLEQKSLLIHSLLVGSPINAMYAIRNDDKVYDFIDGKQRSNAIKDFLDNVFSLRDIPPLEFSDGTEMDLTDMYFKDLPDYLQDEITQYTITVYWFEDLTDEQVNEMFYRLNGGVQLRSVERSRARAKALHDIQILGHHPVFDFLTDKARERYTDEDLVTKSFAMINMETPCLDTKEIRPFMEKLVINKADHDKMWKIYDNIKKMHDEMIENEAGTPAKRLYVKTHFLSIIPFVAEHGKQTEFLQHFFSGERMSISKKYNDNATAGVGHAPAVKARLEAIEAEWKKFH